MLDPKLSEAKMLILSVRLDEAVKLLMSKIGEAVATDWLLQIADVKYAQEKFRIAFKNESDPSGKGVFSSELDKLNEEYAFKLHDLYRTVERWEEDEIKRMEKEQKAKLDNE